VIDAAADTINELVKKAQRCHALPRHRQAVRMISVD
jgi:hypothetical protein